MNSFICRRFLNESDIKTGLYLTGDHPFEHNTSLLVLSFFIFVYHSLLVGSEFLQSFFSRFLHFFKCFFHGNISFILLCFVGSALVLSSDVVKEEVIRVTLGCCFIEFSSFHNNFRVRKLISNLDVLPLTSILRDLTLQHRRPEMGISC